MNILILTGRFGMGHIKCAEALKESILKENPDAQVSVVDFIEYLFPQTSGLIYSSFDLLVSRLSKVYNYLNKAAGHYGGVPLKNSIAILMEKMMAEYKPDLIVCNLPVCGQYYSAYLKCQKRSANAAGFLSPERMFNLFGEKTVPFYVYVTDITFHKEWVADGAAKYFVGDETTKKALMDSGVQENNIHITGIPVSERFSKENEVKHIPSKEKILVMGGGLGLVPGGETLLKTLNDNPSLEVTLVCGTNEKLKKSAESKYANLKVLGFTDKVPELMKESDLIITKPGGITTFEAIKSETPLYIINPELEQEIGNAQFIERNNIGKIIYKEDDFSEKSLVDFLENREEITEMKNNMRSLSRSFERSNPVYYFEKALERKEA